MLFLDHQNRLIEFSEMFRGTIGKCHVHAREVAKEALRVNASAVIFAHNHPSGHVEPSGADIDLTGELKGAPALFDVRVLDHVVIGGTACVSMAERGLIH